VSLRAVAGECPSHLETTLQLAEAETAKRAPWDAAGGSKLRTKLPGLEMNVDPRRMPNVLARGGQGHRITLLGELIPRAVHGRGPCPADSSKRMKVRAPSSVESRVSRVVTSPLAVTKNDLGAKTDIGMTKSLVHSKVRGQPGKEWVSS
jgi:hypothetical protein